MRHRILLLAIVLPLASIAYGGNKKDEEAIAALIERAKQLSDIRADGATPFRMKMRFKITEDDGAVADGEYIETWISKAKWRKELVVGNFWSIQIAGEGKRWGLDSGTVPPVYLAPIYRLPTIHRIQADDWKAGKIEARQVAGVSARCIHSPSSTASVLCFDEKSGTIIAESAPRILPTGIRELDCFNTDYEDFAGHVFS